VAELTSGPPALLHGENVHAVVGPDPLLHRRLHHWGCLGVDPSARPRRLSQARQPDLIEARGGFCPVTVLSALCLARALPVRAWKVPHARRHRCPTSRTRCWPTGRGRHPRRCARRGRHRRAWPPRRRAARADQHGWPAPPARLGASAGAPHRLGCGRHRQLRRPAGPPAGRPRRHGAGSQPPWPPPAPRPRQVRPDRRRAAARAVLAGTALGQPKQASGVAASLRQLRAARQAAVKAVPRPSTSSARCCWTPLSRCVRCAPSPTPPTWPLSWPGFVPPPRPPRPTCSSTPCAASPAAGWRSTKKSAIWTS
jgi:hypothetical protein